MEMELELINTNIAVLCGEENLPIAAGVESVTETVGTGDTQQCPNETTRQLFNKNRLLKRKFIFSTQKKAITHLNSICRYVKTLRCLALNDPYEEAYTRLLTYRLKEMSRVANESNKMGKNVEQMLSTICEPRNTKLPNESDAPADYDHTITRIFKSETEDLEKIIS